jgi:hypothetical protein
VGKGTGLGLYVAHSLVLNAGGEINFFSERDVGTTFELIFPVTDIQDEDLTEDSGDFLKIDSALSRERSVLIVDDEEFIRNILRENFKELGFKVYTASQGREAYEILKAKNISIDMLVTDLKMPIMSGQELIGRIVEEKIPVEKIVVITGEMQLSEEPLVSSTYIDKIDYTISKPFTYEKLKGIVSSLF